MKILFADDWPETLSITRLGLIKSKMNCQASGKGLLEEIKLEEAKVRNAYKLEMINQVPTIVEARKAYKLAGNDPNRYRPSADSLLRRIVKGQSLYLINNLVDALNLVSIRTGFSIGAYDEHMLEGEVSLGLGRANEEYSGIGRGKLNITNLPVLRDEIGAFGSPTSDSARTMITDKTDQIVLVFFDFGRNELLDSALALMNSLLIEHCDGREMTSLTIDS